jgi:hypothetical protein
MFVIPVVLMKVGTALSADWLRPSRYGDYTDLCAQANKTSEGENAVAL